MRILIIEDNIDLANSLKIGLENKKFKVDIANKGEDGKLKVEINEYDAILLDLNLPDIDGINLLKFFRKMNYNFPIIIITARDNVKDLSIGLDNGADDYITKPFELLEVSSRLNAVIRRFHGRTNPIINIGALEVNPLNRVAKIRNKEIDLSIKEFDILEYLAYKYPAIVSSEEIIEHIYDENFDPFSSVLRVHISRLKNKLNKNYGQDILVNLRGKGYSLCIE